MILDRQRISIFTQVSIHTQKIRTHEYIFMCACVY